MKARGCYLAWSDAPWTLRAGEGGRWGGVLGGWQVGRGAGRVAGGAGCWEGGMCRHGGILAWCCLLFATDPFNLESGSQSSETGTWAWSRMMAEADP
jgi:hypothetical protein